MKAFFNNIKKHWFIAVAPERLAVLRIATGGFCLWYLLSRFDMLQRMVGNTEAFDPVGILNWMVQPISETVFWWISIGLIILNVAYIIGWKFKFTGPAFAILILLYFTYRNSWSMIYHNRNGLILHIVILGLVASADAWSWDAWQKKKKGIKTPNAQWQYGWPIQLICAATVCTYLLSGIAKVAGDLALEWANGSAMRSQVAVDALRKEILVAETSPFFSFIYEHAWLFLVMGILTFVIELGAPIALVKRRWGMVWAVMTWLMHWGIFFIMGITFRYQLTGLMFLSFFDVEKLWKPSQHKSKMTLPEDNTIDTITKPVVLFDGVCNLCNGWVQFILKREKDQRYQFASLQSDIGQRLLAQYSIDTNLSSIVVIEQGNVYQKSDAVLRICSHLNAPWSFLALFTIVPRFIRNKVYDVIATNRYKWFGKQQQCALLPVDKDLRFLDS
ncbi:DCC1-like thiol-disulfide oxidoreductase family protein [Aquimarina algicola]|nr:DCC1-like thiol-disulfide oxidoreductase family protein [Aquimarina algicola]